MSDNSVRLLNCSLRRLRLLSSPLLTDMEHDKALFEVHHANNSITSGSEFQTPCVVYVVLAGQLKSHEIEVEHRYKYTTHTHGFTPS